MHATSEYLESEKTNYVQRIPRSIAAVDLGVHRGSWLNFVLQAPSALELPRAALGRSHLPRDNVANPGETRGGGLISVLGNWPLGAVVTDKDGPIPAPGWRVSVSCWALAAGQNVGGMRACSILTLQSARHVDMWHVRRR